MEINDLNGLSTKVENLCQSTNNSTFGFSTTSGIFNTSNPMFYVIVGFIAVVIILFIVRPRMICTKVDKEGEGKPEYKINYKRAAIAVFVLALISGGVILGLYFKNKKKNMLL